MVPRLELAHFAKDATILSVQSGPVASLYIVQRGLVGSRPDSLQADPDRTLGARRAVPGRRAVGRRHDDQDLPRDSRTRTATCSRAPIFSSCGGVAGVRALLHAGDHRDAEAVAREPVQPVQPAGRGAADADAHARRARAASARSPVRRRRRCARRRRRWPTPRCAPSSSSTPTARRSACSRWSTCCAASCSPDPSLDTPLVGGDDGADRHAARLGDRVRGDARDGRARHPTGRRRRERPALRRHQRARPLRAAAGDRCGRSSKGCMPPIRSRR